MHPPALSRRQMLALGAVVVAGALLPSRAALAYRPSARALFGKAMDRAIERAVKSLRVECDVDTFDASGTVRASGVHERMQYLSPGAVRRETDVDDGVVVEVRADGKSMVRTPGQPDKAGKAPVDVLADSIVVAPPMTSDQAVERLVNDCKTLGINTDVVSYARFDGRVNFLIGSKSYETDKPQLWLDKDLMLVTRVVALQKSDAGGAPVRVETRFLGWGSPVGGNWYPQAIESWRDERLVRRSVTRSVEKNLPLDASAFVPR